MGLFTRKSTGRKQSASDNESSGTTTPSSDGESHELTKTQSRLKRMTSGFRSHRARRSSEQEWAHLNKPLTRQNLEHQKMLSNFEWNFGRRGSNISNISPCGSRAPSFDLPRDPLSSSQDHPSSSRAKAAEANRSDDLPAVDEVECTS